MLHLIRHGQSGNNAAFAAAPGGRAYAYPGRVPDPDLTALGRRQAQALADAVRDGRTPLGLTHLYSSLPLRAVRTAAPLAEALDLPLVLRDDAHEVGGLQRYDPATEERHAVAGRSMAQLRAVCPRVVGPAGHDPEAPWDGGFETEDDALPRAQRLLAALRRAHGGSSDVVGLVSHQHFGQYVLAALLGLTGPTWRRFRIDNTGHLAVDLAGATPHVLWVNRVDHLAPDDVTN